MQLKAKVGVTGAKRMSQDEYNIRPMVKNLMEQHPDSGVDELWPLFLKDIGYDDDNEFVLSALDYSLANCFRSLLPEVTYKNLSELRRAKKESNKAQVALISAGVTAAITKGTRDLVKTFVILNDIMPNGKKLGDCTFSEVSVFGDTFSAIGKLGKPNQRLKDVLTNGDLRSLQEGEKTWVK